MSVAGNFRQYWVTCLIMSLSGVRGVIYIGLRGPGFRVPVGVRTLYIYRYGLYRVRVHAGLRGLGFIGFCEFRVLVPLGL